MATDDLDIRGVETVSRRDRDEIPGQPVQRVVVGHAALSGWDFACASIWEDSAMAEPSTSWVRCFWNAIEPSCSGVYVNTVMHEGAARVRAAYGPNYDRLVVLKNKYDPTNFFRMNQNIEPSV